MNDASAFSRSARFFLLSERAAIQERAHAVVDVHLVAMTTPSVCAASRQLVQLTAWKPRSRRATHIPGTPRVR
jgi:hypothetical protein